MYEEWFMSIVEDNDERDLPTTAEMAVIKSFIDGQITATEAAQRCTARIAAEDEPNPEFIWFFCEDMAMEIPDTQDKVVELLAAIKKLPDPIRNGKPSKIYSEKGFSQLAYFCAGFRDSWSGRRDTPRVLDQPLGPEKWAQINAFAARLTTQYVIDWRQHNVRTIDDALEERNLKDSKRRQFFLPAAAMQIIHGALPLWNLGNEPGADPRPNPYNDWVSWRSKLGELAENADVSEDIRKLLRQAVEVMDTVAQRPETNAWSV